MTGHWIAEARADYEARPWVSWALAARVGIHEPLVTISDAANALIDRLDLAAIDAAIGAEVRCAEQDKQRALVLIRTVTHFLRDDGVAKDAIVDAMVKAYAARGIEI